MQAFLTGSRAYGIPEEHSDWDIVVYMTPSTKQMLGELSDRYNYTTFGTLRFGPLNIIPATTVDEYMTWLLGTRQLRLLRDETGVGMTNRTATEVFQLLWKITGVYEDWRKDPKVIRPPSLSWERFEHLLREKGLTKAQKQEERRERRNRERHWQEDPVRPPGD